MKLKDYLELKRITDREASTQLGITREYLNMVKNGRPAGRKLALRVVAWSKGAVTLEELLS